ncbi:hypothetical protein RFI_16529 [Reticulomyxa filosa]|uniref:Ku C-terminal domain-containing protein n=1 Tax=Reticulomyxa filosa TaxID=46433 RepID=X6N449_RETFI|nr:hypothetical protein RFI_16529 [Reticulomyxa filosa]|eukprot:ETO20688.1 hypothetical protein RFI_16529 [Reticulomyxa filosa]
MPSCLLCLQLSKEMWTVIHQMIEESFQDALFEKAVECIAHLRKVSILEEEPLPFNEELRKFKLKYELKKPSLWKVVVNKRVSLLSDSDFTDTIDGLIVNEKQAKEFLQQTKEVNARVESTDVGVEDEDDLGLV